MKSHETHWWANVIKQYGLPAALLLVMMVAASDLARARQPGDTPRGAGSECVILLHGLGRTYRSMNGMERALAAAGYSTANIDYPARKQRIEELARRYLPAALERCAHQGATAIHFVTHSLGAILLRYYLTQERPANLGRVVMLSPPNQGSEAADLLRDETWYRKLNGPAGQQLGTDARGLPAQLGPVDYPVGVITGNRTAFFDAWLSRAIPGEDDGKVAVERAKVEGMADFLVLPYAHPYIMNVDEVIAQTIHFLRTGAFSREAAPERESRRR